MKGFTLSIFLFFLIGFSFGQSKFSVGFQGGVSKLSTFSSQSMEELPGFSPYGTLSGVGLIYGAYEMNKNWFTKIGVGGVHLGMGSKLNGINGNVQSLGNQTINLQLVGSLGKNFFIGNKGWGSYLGAGISMTQLDLSGDRVYTQENADGIRFQGVVVTNGQGDMGEVLANNLRIYNTSKNVLWHIRPELGVFKQFGKQKISLAFIYGYKLREELFVVNYNSLSFFEKNYSEMHGTTGSFVSLQLGYEIKF
jgi:hypothetical protein